MKKQYLKEAQDLLLHNFHEAAERVPAYKDFLELNNIKHKEISTIEDYKRKVPFITKENYLRKYTSSQLTWNGDMYKANILSLSSGSTGEPYVWLRDSAQRAEAQEIYFKLYKDIFNCDTKTTLLIVCFSMGTWIAGSYTSIGSIMAAEEGLKMNIITPALDIDSACKIIETQHKNYDQMIIAGYPPLVKDLIDEANSRGQQLNTLNVCYTLAGEQISEELRNYILHNGTSLRNLSSVINIYGTADAGILSHESPETIKVRRQLYESGKFKQKFGKDVLPSFHAYDPKIKYLEQSGDDIIVNSYSGIPLFRYKIKDKGGIIDLWWQHDNSAKNPYINCQYVYVHGRDDFTVSLYAVLIYPENIKDTLIESFPHILSGRFYMSVDLDSEHNQFFTVTVETLQELSLPQKIDINESIVKGIIEKNSEFAKLHEAMGDKVLPSIIFLETNKGIFAKRGTDNKQKWVV